MPNIDFTPTKRFFVEMLVRDIELADAILDLLDNCVDGAQRQIASKGASNPEKPYEGFNAYIKFDEGSFSISDNCGGIPRDTAEHKAFRLGRPANKPGVREEELPTVGAYGIGMKRAIFKLGKRARVATMHELDQYYVDISPEWMEDDDSANAWKLNLQNGNTEDLNGPGTHISVDNLHSGIALEFSSPSFLKKFVTTVGNYYSLILAKGFSVYINGEKARPAQLSFLLDTDATDAETPAIRPYTFEYDNGPEGVNVKLAIGLFKRLPSPEDEDEDLEGGSGSRAVAGWTIIANDRVILYADRTISTGWGDARVPAYHSQFASISGVVIFSSKHPRLLPITTTKRGVDGNSQIYLQVKDRMRTGMKLFTSFTNKWKKAPEQARTLKDSIPPVDFFRALESTRPYMRNVSNFPHARLYQPVLPVPASVATERWIRFRKPIEEVETLSRHYFETPDASPSDVGSRAFDIALAEVSE